MVKSTYCPVSPPTNDSCNMVANHCGRSAASPSTSPNSGSSPCRSSSVSLTSNTIVAIGDHHLFSLCVLRGIECHCQARNPLISRAIAGSAPAVVNAVSARTNPWRSRGAMSGTTSAIRRRRCPVTAATTSRPRAVSSTTSSRRESGWGCRSIRPAATSRSAILPVVDGVHVEQPGKGGQVDRAARGQDHHGAELRDRQRFIDIGNGLCRDRHQQPRCGQQRVGDGVHRVVADRLVVNQAWCPLPTGGPITHAAVQLLHTAIMFRRSRSGESSPYPGDPESGVGTLVARARRRRWCRWRWRSARHRTRRRRVPVADHGVHPDVHRLRRLLRAGPGGQHALAVAGLLVPARRPR